MPTVNRIGMFETNSSSSHSLIIERGDYIPDRIPVSADGVIRIYGLDHGGGHEPEDYNDAATKAAFCLAHAAQASYQINESRDFDSTHQAWMLRKAIADATSNPNVVFVQDSDNFDFCSGGYGYIDHDSVHVGNEAFESVESLRDFIFNPKSVLTLWHNG